MRYRELGKTGLKISAISFGASALGEEYDTIEQAEGEPSLIYCIIESRFWFLKPHE